ncbi:helix-turn-helix domain-containing protein [Nocardia vinacea]|uniref:helix-turn-helix domain-containing protein n=1 Tax=Nocardia vinacea TaxID=96468 RepID=UPI003F4D5DD1
MVNMSTGRCRTSTLVDDYLSEVHFGDVELSQLRCFVAVAVAENRHFGRAAEQLHLSPSPVSRMIRDLEGELGGDLSSVPITASVSRPSALVCSTARAQYCWTSTGSRPMPWR